MDGEPKKIWNDGLLTKFMYLMVNSWFPTWLDGRKPRMDRFLLIDRSQHTQQP